MRIFSYAFHILLGLFLLGIGAVAWISGQPLQIGILPLQGAALTYFLFFSGLAGTIITLLAIFRVIPVLFTVWALAVLVMLVRGYFFSSYNFAYSSLSTALYFVAAALIAFIGSWPQFGGRAPEMRRKSALA